MTLEELQTLLAELFPVRGGLMQMELGETPVAFLAPPEWREREESLRLTLRLITWERRPKSRELQVRDVKEQELYLGPASLLQRGDRLDSFLRASCTALQQLFEEGRDLDTLMPHDLWQPQVLKLARPQTPEDFLRAILMPSRLGKYLPASTKKVSKRST